jgi:hypothetical protein
MPDHHDPMYRVHFGATATRDADDLADAKQQLHDRVVDDLGDRRSGPVVWRWWPATDGVRVLDEHGWPAADGGLRQYLRDNPDGWLVVAGAPVSEGEAVTPMESAPCGCQWSSVGDDLMFEPCSTGCDLYRWVREEAARQRKPLTTLDLRGGGRG